MKSHFLFLKGPKKHVFSSYVKQYFFLEGSPRFSDGVTNAQIVRRQVLHFGGGKMVLLSVMTHVITPETFYRA